MCLTETLDEMVQNGTLSPELAIQVLVQFDKVLSLLSFSYFPFSFYAFVHLTIIIIMIYLSDGFVGCHSQ